MKSKRFSLYKRNILLIVFVSFFGVLPIQAQQINILLKGGHVIDPANGIDSPMDVAISEGKILQVARTISADQAEKVVDATGLYVTPGLIDMHTHVFHGTQEVGFNGFEINNSFGSVAPDGFTFRSGVTTVVDAGSSGWRDFHLFKKQTVDNSETRVLAFISIAGSGMLGTLHAQYLDDMDPEVTAFRISQYPDILVGIKAHHYRGPDFTPVERAVEAGELANVPVMVDFGGHDPPLSLEILLMEKLRPGDILTHTHFSSGTREGLVDEDGQVKPFAFAAQKRGIIFDVGHGGGGFQYAQAIPSIEQGLWPNTISTDLYRWSMNRGMKDISNIMSKFMMMGMSVQDVILRTTWNPANVIQRTDLGNLSEGSVADVAVFNLMEGDFGYLDARGFRIEGTQKLVAELTIRAGNVAWDLNGIAAPAWGE
jgi:dihydroorotase